MPYKRESEEIEIVAPGTFIKAEKKFTPLFSGVAVQVLPETMTAGGIHIPQVNAKGGSYLTPRALVIAIGPDVVAVQEGDEVILGNAPMACVGLKGSPELIVVAEAHIVGIVGQVKLYKRKDADGNDCYSRDQKVGD